VLKGQRHLGSQDGGEGSRVGEGSLEPLGISVSAEKSSTKREQLAKKKGVHVESHEQGGRSQGKENELRGKSAKRTE